MQILLASQSPRRRELMRLVTPHFATCVADFDEDIAAVPQSPAAMAEYLATEKGRAAANAQGRPGDVVIGCDTVVELAGKALGKPHTREEACNMLTALAGQKHVVHTGVALWHNGAVHPFTAHTAVYFSEIPAADIEAYVKTDEPYDKAGGYGIQGWAAKYIPRIDGCYYNVMGLPVAELYNALRGLGIET